jgi:hypothetical protein
MSKKIILAAILAAFTASAVDIPAAFAKSPKPTRNFNADGGRGGSRNSGDNSGNGGFGGEINNAGKAKSGTTASARGGNGGNRNSGNGSGNGGDGGKISF